MANRPALNTVKSMFGKRFETRYDWCQVLGFCSMPKSKHHVFERDVTTIVKHYAASFRTSRLKPHKRRMLRVDPVIAYNEGQRAVLFC